MALQAFRNNRKKWVYIHRYIYTPLLSVVPKYMP